MPVPDLSVVISTHARPVEVREAIAAVRDQDYDGVIETIVVYDKADPDPTLNCVEANRPVRVMANDHEPGLPGSRNAGVAASDAPVVGFSDDDDLWLRPKARLQMELLGRTGAPTVGCGIEISSPEGDVYPRRSTGSAARFEDLIRTRIPEAYMGTVLVRREAFDGPIGPLDAHIPGGYAEDYEWWLRAARHSPIPLVQQPLFRIRWEGGSFFRDKWDAMERASASLLEEFPEFNDDRVGLAQVQGKRAFALAAQGRRADAGKLIGETLRANWKEPRAVLAALVVAGVPAQRILGALNARGRGI